MNHPADRRGSAWPCLIILLALGLVGVAFLVISIVSPGWIGIIGAVIRGDEIIIPSGEDIIEPGDEVIVFALPQAIAEIEMQFA